MKEGNIDEAVFRVDLEIEVPKQMQNYLLW